MLNSYPLTLINTLLLIDCTTRLDNKGLANTIELDLKAYLAAINTTQTLLLETLDTSGLKCLACI